jgi:hypothetical protein
VGVIVAVGVDVAVAVGVAVAVAVGVALGVTVGVVVGLAVGVGVGVEVAACVTTMQAENSDVSPVDRRLAVAVACSPTATSAGPVAVNSACPAPSVVTDVDPRNRAPSP